MGECVDCGTSGVFLRTGKNGLCQGCQDGVRDRFESEKQRLKEAVIFAGVLTNPRDQALHLRRAMASLRALRKCEDFGCGPVKPDLHAISRALSERLQALEAEREDDAGGEPVDALPVGGFAPVERRRHRREGDRRRARRKPEALPVQLGKGRVRALATDISAGGACIHSPVSRPPGTRVGVTLHFTQGPIAAEGLVRWARPVGRRAPDTGPALLGLEFEAPLQAGHVPRRTRRHPSG